MAPQKREVFLDLPLLVFFKIPLPALRRFSYRLSAGSVADWLLEGAISAAGRVSDNQIVVLVVWGLDTDSEDVGVVAGLDFQAGTQLVAGHWDVLRRDFGMRIALTDVLDRGSSNRWIR